MPKIPPPGRCVHCLRYFEFLTWDHVLPVSWYPKGVNNFEKWKVPSCERCNKSLGKVEENILNKLGLCLDPQELSSLGIPEKTLRALNPEFGRNERDKTHRQSKRNKILKDVEISKELPQNGILPNFGPLRGLEYKEYASLQLDLKDMEKFAEKLTRGITYVADSAFIENTYKIESFFVEDEKATGIKILEGQNSILLDRRPGLLVKRLLVDKEKNGGVYYIEVWERLKICVFVFPFDLINRFSMQK